MKETKSKKVLYKIVGVDVLDEVITDDIDVAKKILLSYEEDLRWIIDDEDRIVTVGVFSYSKTFNYYYDTHIFFQQGNGSREVTEFFMNMSEEEVMKWSVR